MTHNAISADRYRRSVMLTLAVVVALGLAYAWPAAQTQAPPASQTGAKPQAQSPAPAPAGAKKALTVDDYAKWRSISGQEISGDGKWVAYGLSFTNTATADAKPVQHLLNLTTNQDIEIPNGTGAKFSADSAWIAYSVDPSGGG